MQQPFTNSEGVRRCLTVPTAPRSSQLRFEPRPPYAAGPPTKLARPSSAPTYHQLTGGSKPAWHGSNFHKPRQFGQVYCPPSRGYKALDSNLYSPYASRKMEAFVNSTLGYPRVENGKEVAIPSYDPMQDPHLNEYFERRFGLLQLEELKRQRMLRRFARPHSASSVLGSRSRGLRVGGKWKKDSGDVLYKVAVTTGDVKNAGTDAKVFLKMKGVRGKLPKTRLTKKAGSVRSNKGVAFRFAKGSTHVFKIYGPNIGDIQSLVVETSAVKKEEAWFLKEIEIVNTKTKKTYLFTCNQWFSLYHGDGQVMREFFPVKSAKTEYEIVTVTGDVLHGGTNANVFVTLFGKTGSTRKIHLKNDSKTLFDRGSSDVFRVKAHCVGPMKKIRIEHDNQGIGAGWYLERVVVTDVHNTQWKYFFPCGQWLAKDEGDGAISRDLIGSRDPMASRKASKYKVTVYTGNKSGAGTDANVYITMFGEFGDSGEKKLTSRKNNFERGKADEFLLECPKLGRLERIRIGHDNSGFGPGWFLDKVIVDDVDMGTVFEFPCNRWFALDEDDGQISREIILNVGPSDASPGIPYVITVKTGDVRGAGTDSRVYIILHGGDKGNETSGTIWLETGSFERNITDLFKVDVMHMLSPLSHLDIGHDNTGAASGWFLDHVIVYCPVTGIEQFFSCNKWLATDEGDGLIQRTLQEQTGQRKKKEKKMPWQVWVFTSDIKHAGTDASVYMVLYGDKGKSDDIKLENKGDNFEQGHMDMFKIETNDVGTPYKIRVWHDNSGVFAGWHLNKMEMQSLGSKTRYSFPCDRWLADSEDDKEIIRELPATGPSIKKPLPVVHYKVEVYTGKKSGGGTDANVYLNIFGELGDTGKRYLKHSKNNKNKFEKGQVDEFEIEAVTLLKMKKIRIGHDGRGSGAGWFLDKVVISQVGSTKYDTEFTCNRWLAEDEDDGHIERELTAGGAQMLNTTTYHVHVKTGDVRSAGTDANVFLKIFGVKGDTDSVKLRSSESGSNKFERGRTDVFKVETTDIGKIKKIKVGHDGSKPGAGWFLDEIHIEVPSRGEHYIFACHRWLATDEGDRQLEVELEPSSKESRDKKIPYEMTVWTSDMKGAGTDANVFLQMYGVNGKTEELQLRNKTDNFEKGNVDKFKVEAADIGQLQKVRIGHDGKGMFSGWHLEKMLIQRQTIDTGKKKIKKKLSDQDRRKSLINMHRQSEDEESDSSSPSSTPRRGGRRKSSHYRSASKLDAVIEEDEADDETDDYWFFVNQWFATSEGDGQIVREFIPTDEKGRPLKGQLEAVEYAVHVFTGDEFGAGTDSNVFVTLYGEKGDTGERQLKESGNRNKFERKQEDVFSLKAIDLGRLVKVKIRHDNQGMGSAWFLDRVEVNDTKRKKNYFFPCQRWLATGKDDGQISRELVPVDAALKRKLSHRDSSTAIRDEIGLETKAAMTTYHVKVTTGDVWGAGTDANVFIILYGDIDSTGKMFLKSSLTNKNKFERNKMDEFILETVKIGELKKIRIGHDNAGGGAAWHLNNIVIDCPSLGATWTFPCNRWLSEKDDDGQIERELYPQELETTQYKPCIPYEITTYTSDVSGASTDADVYVVLYGKDDCTQKKSLCINKKERKERFKKASSDKFVVEMEDIGDTIEKIRIGHDGTGFGAGWHLDKVEVRRLHDTGKGSITHVFPCRRWLARGEDDGAIERELLPEKITKEMIGRDGKIKTQDVKIQDKLKAKKYIVEVFTGDGSGSGTDANVFLNIFGDKGDSGERKLHSSETNRDKFERGKMDRFALEAVDLGKIYKIRIRHDNSMFNPAWFLDRVEITDVKEKYIFHCERWLAKNKEDGKIERSLYVKGYDGEMSSTGTVRSTKYGSVASLDSMRDPFSKSPRLSRKQLQQSLEDVYEGPLMPYTIKVTTGEGEDNGTSSNVWIKFNGPKKKTTGRLFLELAQKDSFAPGSVEIFSLEAAEMDEIKNIEIGHDGTAPGTGWFLKEAEVDMPTKGKHYHFNCGQWLARDNSDGKTTRLLSVDDGTSSLTSYNPLVPYEVTVTTGDVSGAGTDAKISMTVFGTKGSSAPIELEKNEDRFERARTDLIKVELKDIAPLKKLRVALNTKGVSRKTWYLEKIELRNMDTGNMSVFKYDSWLGKGKEGAQMSADIPAIERGKKVIDKTDYKVTVKTSDVRGAGTDANVYIILFGLNGDSGDLHLKDSETNKSPFGNGQVDVFTIKGILSLGELSKLRVWHDNKGFGASWHLSSIEVEDLNTRKVSTFHCDRWLSKSEDDKQILRELTCATAARPGASGSKDKVAYEIEVTTADKKDGGTYHNGWLILEGSKSTSKVFVLSNSAQNKILRRGQTDNFTLTSNFLGKLESCIVGAFEREDRPIEDARGREATWFCHEVVVTDTSTGNRYTFPCKTWIDILPKISKNKGRVCEVKAVEESKMAKVRNLAPVKYEVVVYTGDVKGAGTNANVSINIFGENGDTGVRELKQRFRDLFERNQVDKFQFEALDLGELTKVHIEHDNSGFRPGWFLDRVEIVNMGTSVTIVFPCGKWLDRDKGDNEIGRDLFPKVDL